MNSTKVIFYGELDSVESIWEHNPRYVWKVHIKGLSIYYYNLVNKKFLFKGEQAWIGTDNPGFPVNPNRKYKTFETEDDAILWFLKIRKK